MLLVSRLLLKQFLLNRIILHQQQVDQLNLHFSYQLEVNPLLQINLIRPNLLQANLQVKQLHLQGRLILKHQYVLVVDGGRHLQKEPSPSSSNSTVSNRSTNSRRSNLLSNWKNVVQETEEAVAKHEVDQYLEAALELIDDLDCFDILLWWKLNQFKYPVLAAIARDVLSIQVSTVASESAFSTGGRVVDCFRSSLTPKTVEGLICMQNWLLGNDIAENIDDCTIENYEFYEGVELEHESTATSKANVWTPPPSRAKAKGKGTAAGPIDV